MKKILNIILIMVVCVSTVGCDLKSNNVKNQNGFALSKDDFNSEKDTRPTFNFDDASLYAADNEKVVEVKKSNVGRSDPFKPMDTIGDISSGNMSLILGKGAEELPIPPGESISSSPDKDTVEIKINGILYDLNRSSAILNIDGNDYVVREGDKIFNLRVKTITPDKVFITYGRNVYKKGVGEGFSGNLNSSPIDGFDSMFAGNKNSGDNGQKLPDIKFVSPTAYL